MSAPPPRRQSDPATAVAAITALLFVPLVLAGFC